MNKIYLTKLMTNQAKGSTFSKIAVLFITLIAVFGISNANSQTQTLTFNSSSTFTVPPGVTSITVKAWGAGGGTRSDLTGSRAGGGGGAYAQSTLTVTPGNVYTITVGTGGAAAATVGQSGGASSFGTLVIADGGLGGSNTGGAGGTTASSTGTIKFAGGAGGARQGTTGGGGGGGGSATATANGGAGAAGAANVGGAGGTGTATGGAGGNINASGNNGNTPGAGGGGRGSNGATAGAGANGRIIVSYDLPDLTVSLSVDTINQSYGRSVKHTIVVSNLGPGQATGIKVNNLLPSGFYFLNYTTTGSGSYLNSTGVWNIGTLNANATDTLRITSIVACGGIYKDSAYVYGNQPDSVGSNNYAIVTVSPSAGTCLLLAQNDYAITSQAIPVQINILSNDVGNVDTTSVSIINQPQSGTIQFGLNGKVTYLPNGSFYGNDAFTYQVCDTSFNPVCDTATVFITVNPSYNDPCLEATFAKTYYLPFPEKYLYTAFRKATNSPGSLSNVVRNVVSISTSPYPNTIITYDHWEDGYETNIATPLQSTTQVWGDGILTNGKAPGYSTDIIPSGGSFVLDDLFLYNTRDSLNIHFDGMDKIYTTADINVSKVTGDQAQFGLQCVKTDVYDNTRFGKLFIVGFGEDVASPTVPAFNYSAIFVRANQNNTTVSIDADGNGTIDSVKVLNEGGVWFYQGNPDSTNKVGDIKVGAVVTADKEIGLDAFFGDINNYGSRNINILPGQFYGSTYFSPVPTTRVVAPASVYFYNSVTDTLKIDWTSGSGSPSSGTIIVNPKGYNKIDLNNNSGYKFQSQNGKSYTAVEIIDSDNPGRDYDWAFNLIAKEKLTNYVSLAWAPGSTTPSPSNNYNPIWITPDTNTTIYIKFDGDLTSTIATKSPCNIPYDSSFTLNALNYARIFDNRDGDQSKMAIFTCNGAKIAGVYGQDANLAPAAAPGFDAGTIMIPKCLNVIVNSFDDRRTTLPSTPIIVEVMINDNGFLCTLNSATVDTVGVKAAHGTVVLNGDGTVTYTPDNGFIGVDYFDYQICSNEYPGICDISRVYINVTFCAAQVGENLINGQVFLELLPDDSVYNSENFLSNIKVDLYADINCNGAIDGGENVSVSTVTDIGGNYSLSTNGGYFAKDDMDESPTINTGNDGSINWSSSWVEITASNGFGSSPVSIDVDYKTDSKALIINGTNSGASRSANFSNAISAVLKFDYRRDDLEDAGEQLSIIINQGTAKQTTLYTIDDGNGVGTDNYYQTRYLEIPAANFYATGNNTVRFITNGNVNSNDYYYLDNIELIYFVSPSCFISQIDTAYSNGRFRKSKLKNGKFSFNTLGNCSNNNDLSVVAVLTASNDYKTGLVDVPVTIPVLFNDVIGIPDSTKVTTVGLLQPSNGTTLVNNDGTITYLPNTGFVGNDSFQYQVCSKDDPNVCSIAKVYITISCVSKADTNVVVGFVYHDVNRSGTLNSGEVGLNGIKLYLYKDLNFNNTVNIGEPLADSITTDATGIYQFNILPTTKTDSLLDQFNTNGDGSTNNGNKNFAGSWVEITETDGFNSGDLRITNNSLRVRNNDRGARRTANISNAVSATLTFDYAESSLDDANDWVEAQIATSSGGTYTTLARYDGAGGNNSSGSASFNITNYIAGATTIRFIASSNLGSNDQVTFDNIKIKYISYDSSAYVVQLATPLITGVIATSTPASYGNKFGSAGAGFCSRNFGLDIINISGTIYDDRGGLTDNTVNGSAIGKPSATAIYANLLNASNNVVNSVKIDSATGTYNFNYVAAATYSIQLSTIQGTIGQPAPASSLPTNWVNTGEKNGAGSGSDGTANGTLVSIVVTTNDITNANFGIDQRPVGTDKTAASQVNPGGTVKVQTPSLAATDLEDGAKGTGSWFIINTLPTKGILYYNNVAITAGDTIKNYDSTKLTVDPTFNGSGTLSFTFTSLDSAKIGDASPNTITMPFTSLTIGGTVFDDRGGLTDNTINGTGLGNPSTTQLYANLVDSATGLVRNVVAVTAGTGVYTISDSVNANTGYRIVLSTTQGTIGSAAPSAALPTNWVNVGEQYGSNNNAGTGIESGTPNGDIRVSTGTTNPASVNFGIDQRPAGTDKTAASQVNPGGTVKVQTPSLAATDLEDGAKGTGSWFIISSLPSNGTLYYNNVAITAGDTIKNYDSTKLAVDPTFHGAGTLSFTFTSLDSAKIGDSSPNTITLPFTGLTISGTLFDDRGGMTDAVVNGTGIDAPSSTTTYVYMVDVTSGLVIGKDTLNSGNGTYTFTNQASNNTAYSVRVSTSDIAIGASGPGSANLPTNWVSTGENFGSNNNAGSGNESGTANSQIAVTTTTSSVTGVNFGIDQRPAGTDKTATSQVNPGGTVKVQTPSLAGTDLEDGAKGTGSWFIISSLPTNATLYYNNIAVTAGDTIKNYDSTKLTVDPTFNGSGSVSFTFTSLDSAKIGDASPNTITMPFTSLTIGGTVFDDRGGLTDGTINGSGLGNPSTTQLYANLVNVATGNVVNVATVTAGTGVYTISDSINASTAYRIVISTTQGTIGSAAPSASLPTNWVNVGEQFGTNNSAGTGIETGTPNGTILVTTGASSNIASVNFGIDQRPAGTDKTAASQVNPGGTVKVQTPSLAATDLEDGAKGTGSWFIINTLPTKGILYYNNVAITAGDTIKNYDSTKLTVDPTFNGSGSVSFTFTSLDSAKIGDASPNTITMPFTSLTIGGTVFDDRGGLTDGTINGSGLGNPSTTQLYANLVNVATGNVVNVATVTAGTGVYTISDSINASTAYRIVISTTQGTIGSAAPSASLPTNWVNVGEQFGTNNSAGTGIETGTPNGTILVTTGASSNITSVSFGIDQRPAGTDKTAASQVNPGGTVKVQTPSLAATDLEDGAKGTGSWFIINTLPTKGILYYNNVAITAGDTIKNYDSTKLTVDPTFNGSGTVTFTFTSLDSAKIGDASPNTITMPFTSLTIGGTVFDDRGGLTDGTINGTGLGNPSSTQLYANLINVATGNVVNVATVTAGSGVYTISDSINASTAYRIVISTTQGTIGSAAPSASIPTNWVNVGEQFGTNNSAGTGIETGTPNGTILVTTGASSNITSVNFGIDQRPAGTDKTAASQVNPGGTVKVQTPSFAGTDLEDGTKGTGSWFIISSLPTNATLYYNNIAVTAGDTIKNYDSTKLTVDPTFNGSGSVSFTFTSLDSAKIGDASPNTITMPFTSLTIGGTVFDDRGGLTDGTINGSGLGNPSTTQLYANLVDSATGLVRNVVAVTAGTGVYTISDSVNANTGYRIVLSTTQGTIGSAAPSAALPTNWVNTGEQYGSNNNAGTGIESGTPNGDIRVSTGTTNPASVNFGIDQRPAGTDKTAASQVNPGGTVKVQTPSLAATDLEDGAKGTGSWFIINTLPTKGILYYNNVAITAGDTIKNYDSTKLTVDPTFNGSGTVTFTFTSLDSAKIGDASPNTITMPFTSLTIGGTVFDDRGGLTDGTINGTGLGNPSSTQLYANLINVATGNVVNVATVTAGSGVYTISDSINASTAYRIVISTTQGTIGSAAPSASIPTNWVNVGEQFGTNNSAGTGIETGTPNGTILVTTGASSNITSVNFGIDQRPAGTDKTAASQVNPGGTVKVQTPSFAGTDLEDGTKGTGSWFIISSLPTNATLYYNNIAVTAGDTIKNYDSTKLTVDPTFNGSGSVSFTFTSLDSAKIGDASPNTITMPFTSLTIGGTVFDDRGGLTDGTINGSGLGNPSSTQLYANLVDSATGIVRNVVAVTAGTGVYTISDSVNANTGYQIIISTTQGTIGSSAPSAALPTNWVNVGEQYGSNNASGTGIESGTPNGIIRAHTISNNITSVNFGIDQRPVGTDKTAASQVNPGGTVKVQTPSLAATDLEDGAKGTGSWFIINTLPTNATLYYNNVAITSGDTIKNYDSTKLTVDPTFNGSGSVNFTFTSLDSAKIGDASPNTITLPFTGLNISGTLYNDTNGMRSGNMVDGIGFNNPSTVQMYVNLLDGSNNVLASSAIASNGTYSFTDLNAGSYTVQISPIQGVVNNAAPSGALSGGWLNTGEKLGSGTGNDGTTNGLLAVTLTTSNQTNANFGIEQRPFGTNTSASSQVNPGGTNSITILNTLISPIDSSAGRVDSIHFTTFPTNTTTFTINGVAYTSGTWPVNGVTIIAINNQPGVTLLLDPVNGAITSVVSYKPIDNAGFESASTWTVDLPFTTLSLSGNVYNDQGGLTDNTVNGNGVGLPSSTQLYANLVNGSGNVVATTSVAANGTYSYSGLYPGNYTVQISTNQGVVNSLAPSINLPSGWVNIGENVGSGSGNDGLANGNISIQLISSNITNVNFGIERTSIAYNKTYSGINPNLFNVPSGNSNYPYVMSLSNASGTSNTSVVGSNSTVMPGKVSGSDPEDGNYSGTSGSNGLRTLVLTILPDSTNDVMVYNGTVLKPGDNTNPYWNATNSRYEIPSFNANLLEIYIRKNGHTNTSFDYAWLDSAGVIGTSATYSVSGYGPLPVSLLNNQAQWKEKDGQVTWITASEINTDRFEIERSFDGQLFEKIGEVSAQGNSNTIKSYEYTDKGVKENVASKVYYRIRMVDKDETYTYSSVMELTQEKTTQVAISVYPNPSMNETTITIEQDKQESYQISIIDITGKEVFKGTTNSTSKQTVLDIQSLSAGVYQIIITTNNNRFIKQLVKVNN